ncbi:Leucine-rich repeat-containing protein oda7 [Pleodorina starrii]|uniref:Leucine-rich repeat-containing protein oda7 n=1 Tax=Pleodorina starrii TaxID=330485 RepID=A0A9W6BTY5_9CHLO|nr:Leucine-rich repeat-containing protein oda7 [Pleodorina starrii]GLC58339.1 Leucine-rich repeat-containing protein oda7 [Pleodorina starrii]GLC69430.1 Leucine-rich repeat-containing protein oda7 [Pleodorina starrii]
MCACMTKEALLEICKQNQLYRTPSLNDKLYCNFKGFSHIACLDDYVNLKALFLEGNVLESLEGLPPLKELKCLYVQQNCIHKISGLEAVENLDTLNISNNHLTSLEGLSCCKSLSTLIAAHNHLATLDSVAHLAECTALQTLDLQNNELSDPAILDVLKQIPDLRCLYLKGNPVVSNIRNYRKVVITSIPTLTYLDDRPVFDNERKVAEAWLAGGLDAERAMRNKLKEEEDERNRKNHEFMMQMRAQGWRERRKRLGLPEGDTDPALDNLSDGEYEFEEDPPELVEARQRLAAYTARPGEEEPAELSGQRQQLASEGKGISEGQWRSGAEDDARVYLESVKAAQAELNVAAVSSERDQDPVGRASKAEGAGADIAATSGGHMEAGEVDLSELD